MRTKLSPEACAERLESRIDSDRSWLASWFGTKSVQGHVRRGWASLYKRPSLRNEFQPVLAVSMTPSAGGTRLFCRLSRFWTFWMLVISWGLLSLVFALGVILASRDAAGAGDTVFGVGALAVLIVFGLAYAAFGHLLARNELAFLLDFLKETLEADLVEEAG